VTIKNGQSREAGSIGYTGHKLLGIVVLWTMSFTIYTNSTSFNCKEMNQSECPVHSL